MKITPARSHSYFEKNYFCPRTEFLIGAVKLQLSVKMRHLSVVLTFLSHWTTRKMANSHCKVISFDSALEEARNLTCLAH